MFILPKLRKMHPGKTIISLFAIAGFAQADRLNSREVDVAREQYLVARDEYIQKRSLCLRNAPSRLSLSVHPWTSRIITLTFAG
jgi:hypothetical protein